MKLLRATDRATRDWTRDDFISFAKDLFGPFKMQKTHYTEVFDFEDDVQIEIDYETPSDEQAMDVLIRREGKLVKFLTIKNFRDLEVVLTRL